MQDNQGMRSSPQGFMKDRSCLINLLSFCDKVTYLVHEGNVRDVFYLDFIKALDTLSHCIVLEKLSVHGLDRCTVLWVKNCLDDRAQRAVVNGEASVGHQCCSLGLSIGPNRV